ncbi:MAG: VWA domain-containing protein [Candidatus Methanoperedens sp.]
MLTGLAAAGVNVKVASYPSQITVDESANISIFINQSGTSVNITTNLGNLSAASAITNLSGYATVRINSTATGIATVNASVGGVYNTTNVTFLAGKPAFIGVNVTQNLLVVGNTTVVNLTAYDQYNNKNSTANLTLNIQISDVLGDIKNQTNINGTPYVLTQLVYDHGNVTLTNSISNTSNILLGINSTLAGNITITAKAENTTNTFNITFMPAALSYISLGYNNEYTVNASSTITVGAWDMYDNPLKDIPVTFNATQPNATQYNSPIEYNSLNLTPEINNTNLNGFTTTVFRTDKRAGGNIINITAGNINTSVTIQGIADSPSNLFLTHSPDFVIADNKSVYNLTAQVTDQFQNPVLLEGKTVLFNQTPPPVLLKEGAATIQIGPASFIETVNISAVYNDGVNDIGNSTNLSFVPGNLSRFIFGVIPDMVLYQNGKGNHNASVTLQALDEFNNPIPGINVTLNNTNTTLGTLTVNGTNVTNEYGEIQALFVSNNSVGNDTITAADGSINASLNIWIRDDTFISVVITYEPANVKSGQIVNVTTIVSVEGDVPTERDPKNVTLVLDNSGSMDPDYYAGTPLDILLVSDTSTSMYDQIKNVSSAEVNFTKNLVSNDRVGLEIFNTTVANPSLSRNITDIQNQIMLQKSSKSPIVYTATALAIQTAKNYLVSHNRTGARPIIILLSDGQPTVSLPTDTGDPTFEAINESNNAKNTIINNNSIKIFTIFFETSGSTGSDVLQAIASPFSSYYANSSTIDLVYQNIAQQISDFDISTRQYGTDGFTQYNYLKNGSVNKSIPWPDDNISLNDNVTDFKVQIDNPNVNFTLTHNGTKYPDSNFSGWLNRTGYYNVSSVNSSKGRYIWIEPVNGTYDPVSHTAVVIPRGNWTINVTTGNAINQTFNITTYIDKISAVKIGSYAFISKLNASMGDRAGLVTYSNIPNPPSTVNSTSQSSYLLNGSTWDGYFNGSTPKKNYMLNFTGYNCTRNLTGTGECYITVNGQYAKDFGNTSYAGMKNYSVDITGFVLNGSNTISFYNYSYIYATSPTLNSSIRYVNILENGTSLIWFQNSSNVSLNKTPTSYTFNVSFNTTFNLTWPNSTDNLDFYIYQGGTLLSKSTGLSGNNKTLKATIYPNNSYYVEVNGTNISNETNFTITASQNLTWQSYTANVTAPLEVSNIDQSFDKVNSSIGNMTAVGLTAIDEGLFLANNEFTSDSTQRTIVLMTDGRDNAGYRSLLNEINRAKNNKTKIYTVGLGNNESDIDPILNQTATDTEGQYYFAQNFTQLIMNLTDIANKLTPLNASKVTLNIQLPKNYGSGLQLANSTYITNSSNSTSNKSEYFIVPTFRGNYLNDSFEPNQSAIGNNITLLSWPLPDLTIDDKWGVWYQLRIDAGSYNVSFILPGSNITYYTHISTDPNDTPDVNQSTSFVPGAPPPVNGDSLIHTSSLDSVLLVATPSVVFTGQLSNITVTTMNKNGNETYANVTFNTNLGDFNNSQNPFNKIVYGNDFVNFTSNTAGVARINAIGSDDGNKIVLGSVVIVVKPKGKIRVS